MSHIPGRVCYLSRVPNSVDSQATALDRLPNGPTERSLGKHSTFQLRLRLIPP
jgi:hypothetical protein